jgi:hypothetical protein
MTSRGFSYDPKTVSSTLLGSSDEVVLCSRSFGVFVRVEQSRVNPSRRFSSLSCGGHIHHSSEYLQSFNELKWRKEREVMRGNRCHYYTLPTDSIYMINRNTYIDPNPSCSPKHLLPLPFPSFSPIAYLPSNSLSKADPGCSSESLPVVTSSENAGPTPAPGC